MAIRCDKCKSQFGLDRKTGIDHGHCGCFVRDRYTGYEGGDGVFGGRLGSVSEVDGGGGGAESVAAPAASRRRVSVARDDRGKFAAASVPVVEGGGGGPAVDHDAFLRRWEALTSVRGRRMRAMRNPDGSVDYCFDDFLARAKRFGMRERPASVFRDAGDHVLVTGGRAAYDSAMLYAREKWGADRALVVHAQKPHEIDALLESAVGLGVKIGNPELQDRYQEALARHWRAHPGPGDRAQRLPERDEPPIIAPYVEPPAKKSRAARTPVGERS